MHEAQAHNGENGNRFSSPESRREFDRNKQAHLHGLNKQIFGKERKTKQTVGALSTPPPEKSIRVTSWIREGGERVKGTANTTKEEN